MRVLSRIFGGLLVAVTILFAGISSSFAEMPDSQDKCQEVGYQWDETQGKCCIYYDPIKLGCITDDDWSNVFGGEGCNPEAGYIDDNGDFHCCPGEIGNSSTHLCCTPPEVFDIAQEKCVMSCPYDWYWDEVTQQCCAFYYFDKEQNDYVCVTEEEFRNNIFPEIEGSCENPPYDNGQQAGYVDEYGNWHCCPEGSIPNDTTHQCECDDSSYTFDPSSGQCIESQPTYFCSRGEYYSGKDCETCQPGYYCPGDDTAYQCPAGQYSSTTGAVSCSDISAGYYGSAGATSNHGNGACAQGSYSAAGSSACTACPNGYTTSGTGSTSSSACSRCSNYEHVTTWANQSWSANSVSNLCVISTCASSYERTGSSPYQCTVANTNCYKFAVDNTTNGGNNNNGATTEFWMYLDTSTYNAKNCNIYPTTTDCANGTNVMSGIVLPNPPSGAIYAGQYSTTGNYASSPYNEGWFDSSTGAQNIAPNYNHCSNLSNTQGYYNSLLSTFGFQANSTPSITLRALYSCGYGYSLVNGVCTANTITLDWDESGGSAVSNGTCTYGGNLVLPAAPTLTNYTFTGWRLADGSIHSASETVTGGCIDTYTGTDIGTSYSIQAQWSYNCVIIRVMDDANGGSVTANTNLYKLVGQTGWYIDSNCQQATNGPTSITASKTHATFAGIYDCPGGNSCAGSGTLLIAADGTLQSVTSNGGWVYPQYNCDIGWRGSGTNISGACTQGGSFGCDVGLYLPAGSTTCADCPAGYYCPGWSGSYDGSEHGRTSCSSATSGNYTESATNSTSVNDCYVTCEKGKRVKTVYGACQTDSGPWFVDDALATLYSKVYYGDISPAGLCMYDPVPNFSSNPSKGYTSTGTTAVRHDAITDCVETANGGKYVTGFFPSVTQVRVWNTASSGDMNVVEITAYNKNNQAVPLVQNNGSTGAANIGYAINGSYTDGLFARISPNSKYMVLGFNAAGTQAVDLKRINFGLTRGDEYSGLRIDIRSGTDKWVTVLQNQRIKHTNKVLQNGGQAVHLGSWPISCDNGTYRANAVEAELQGSTATSCDNCPTGWPNSDAGSDELTDCYSGTKSRPWSGSQTACSNPDDTGCSSATCGTCSGNACNYVAYVNSAGNADGTIKSGCSSNNAACTQPVTGLTANTGYHTVNGNLENCPANTYTVTFSAGYGTGTPDPTSVTCTYDQNCPQFPDGTGLSNDPATFSGWNTAQDGSGNATYAGGTTEARNLTSENGATVPLYAYWITNGCPAGQYLSGGSCVNCTAGYYCAGETASPVICPTNKYSTGGAASCTSCATGLKTAPIAEAVYHDDAGDCGRILHIGTYEIRLKSIPSGFTVPSPSLRFDYDNDGTADFYARMSLNASPMRVTSTQQISNPAKNFKTTYNNSTYYVCDDGTCR